MPRIAGRVLIPHFPDLKFPVPLSNSRHDAGGAANAVPQRESFRRHGH